MAAIIQILSTSEIVETNVVQTIVQVIDGNASAIGLEARVQALEQAIGNISEATEGEINEIVNSFNL